MFIVIITNLHNWKFLFLQYHLIVNVLKQNILIIFHFLLVLTRQHVRLLILLILEHSFLNQILIAIILQHPLQFSKNLNWNLYLLVYSRHILMVSWVIRLNQLFVYKTKNLDVRINTCIRYHESHYLVDWFAVIFLINLMCYRICMIWAIAEMLLVNLPLWWYDRQQATFLTYLGNRR